MLAEAKLQRLAMLADRYRRVISGIEQMESRGLVLNECEGDIWDSEGNPDPRLIQRYQELEEERQRLHSEAMRIMSQLGLKFSHRDEAHRFLLGPALAHSQPASCT